MNLYSKLRHGIPWLQLNYLFLGPHHTLSISGSFCIFPHMRIPNSPTLQHDQNSLSLFFLFYWGIPSSLSPLRISPQPINSLLSAEQDSLPLTCPRPASPPGLWGPCTLLSGHPCWSAPPLLASFIFPPHSCLYHLLLENLPDSECCQVLSLPSSLMIKLKDKVFLPSLPPHS